MADKKLIQATITVSKADHVTSKTSGKKFLAIKATTIAGVAGEYSCWDDALWPKFAVGATLTVKYTISGKYQNIQEIVDDKTNAFDKSAPPTNGTEQFAHTASQTQKCITFQSVFSHVLPVVAVRLTGNPAEAAGFAELLTFTIVDEIFDWLRGILTRQDIDTRITALLGEYEFRNESASKEGSPDGTSF